MYVNGYYVRKWIQDQTILIHYGSNSTHNTMFGLQNCLLQYGDSDILADNCNCCQKNGVNYNI